MTNAERRQLLDRHRASGFTGSIVDVLSAARQGIDLIGQFEQQNDIQVANTPEEQQSGLRPAHQAGDINQSMVFPDVPPNTNFNTVGMKAPINIQKFDEQGHLVKSYENVPPGIQSLPTGPQRGTVIETPARMQRGGTYYPVAESTRTQTPIDPRVIQEAEDKSYALKQAQVQAETDMLGYPASYSGQITPTDGPIDWAIGLGPTALKGAATAAKNIYKVNPFANKLNDPNAFYRITGRDAFEDAMSSGVIRSNTKEIPEGANLLQISQGKFRHTPFPSFSKGSPAFEYVQSADDVIFKNTGPMYKRGDVFPSGKTVKGRHWAYRPYDAVNQTTARSIPVEEIYEATPNWLTGYKRIQKLGGVHKMQSGGPTLTREYLENYLAKNRGGTPESWSAAADTIAFHESGWRDRMSPLAMQEEDGPGRGMFQFETTHSESFTTAQNRHKNIADITGTTPDPEIMKATSAEQLPVDKQYALFYSHLIEEPKAPLAKYPTGEMPLVDMWLKGHKKKEKSGDRAAFEASRQAAKKEGIPRGVGYQRGGFLRRPPRTLGRKKRAQ